MIKNQHTKVIKKFRSDHGGEFDNNSLDKIFASKGIVHEYSAPHIHTQNGRARVPKPVIKYGSIYGDKPAIQIEKEIRSERAWQKAIEPKAKVMMKR